MKYQERQKVWITWPYIFGEARMGPSDTVLHEVLIVEGITDRMGKMAEGFRQGVVKRDEVAEAQGWVAVNIGDEFDAWWFRPEQLRPARDGQ